MEPDRCCGGHPLHRRRLGPLRLRGAGRAGLARLRRGRQGPAQRGDAHDFWCCSLSWLFSGARNAQTAVAACSFEYCGLNSNSRSPRRCDACAAQRVPRRLPICVRLSKDAQRPLEAVLRANPPFKHCAGRPGKRGGRLCGFDASILQHASYRTIAVAASRLVLWLLRPQPTYCCVRDAVDGPLLDTSNSRPLATSRRQL